MDELRLQNEELSQKLSSVECQLRSEVVTKEESLKEYQQYVNRLQNELQELKATVSITTAFVSEKCKFNQQIFLCLIFRQNVFLKNLT